MNFTTQPIFTTLQCNAEKITVTNFGNFGEMKYFFLILNNVFQNWQGYQEKSPFYSFQK